VCTSLPHTPEASMAISTSRSARDLGLNCSEYEQLLKLKKKLQELGIMYLFFLKITPLLVGVNHKSLEGVWINHVQVDEYLNNLRWG
jgi:hypothetical protein